MKALLAGLFVFMALCHTVVAQNKDAALRKQLDAQITPLVKGGFSGVVLVECDGNVILRKGYGFADVKAKRPITATMRFDIGSVTKPVVSAAVLVLVQQGKLQLDSKLGDLLKNVPEDKQGITIEQLLLHTGGIPNTYEFTGVDTTNREAVVESILKLKLNQPPGEKHEYCNANYFLLAAIIETLDPRGYDETLRQSIFIPLEMKTAGFTSDPIKAGEKSPTRYDDGAPKSTHAGWPHGWAHRGATGILCSVDDLAAFTKALHKDVPFSAEEREQWLKLRKEEHALGWDVLDQPGRPKVIIHGGSSIGARALLAFYPDSKTTFVVLSNSARKGNLDEWTILRAVAASDAVKPTSAKAR